MTRPLTRLFALLVTSVGLTSGAQVYTTDPLMLADPMYDGDVPIIQPRGLSLHSPLHYGDALVPTITTSRSGPLSYDITYTFTNTTSSSKPLGRILAGAITLGEHATVYDHAQISDFKDISYDSFTGMGWTYPGTAYSPATVLMNDTHVIGVSLLYPVMEYQHDTLVRVTKLGGVFKGPPESRGWMVAFDLNNVRNTSYYTEIHNEAMLEPGQTQSYTICVRAMKRPDAFPGKYESQNWLRVLEPYRDYFRAQFGEVTYERRTKPIYGKQIANESTTNSQNQRGWTIADLRPDRVGFAPLVNYLIDNNYAYDNVMLWAPSGLFYRNRDMNYPSLFTAGWLDSERLETATDQIGFPAIPRSGIELGLWWGRAAMHMESWDDGVAVPLDPDNAEHMQLVYQQMDLAERAGVTTIGLDAFLHRHMPVWKQKPYLEDLRARYPGIRLATEQLSSDLIHTVAPSSNRGYSAGDTPRSEEGYHRLDRPHYLADYLNPGHETWAFWRYTEILRADPSQSIDGARLQRDVERLVKNGYTPVIQNVFLQLEDPAAAHAHATWHLTQPSEGSGSDSDDLTQPDDDGGDADDGDDGDANRGSDDGSDEPSIDIPPTKQPETRTGKVYYITLPNGKRLRIESR